MQDEVNEKTIALYIKTGKLTAQTLQKAMKAILSKGKKELSKPPQGKQSLKQLMKQNAGVSNIEITEGNIKAFESTAKKYGIDFALKKDATESLPRYLVFFKGRDADVLTAAFKEFSAKKLTQEKKPSIRKLLSTLSPAAQPSERKRKGSRAGHRHQAQRSDVPMRLHSGWSGLPLRLVQSPRLGQHRRCRSVPWCLRSVRRGPPGKHLAVEDHRGPGGPDRCVHRPLWHRPPPHVQCHRGVVSVHARGPGLSPGPSGVPPLPVPHRKAHPQRGAGADPGASRLPGIQTKGPLALDPLYLVKKIPGMFPFRGFVRENLKFSAWRTGERDVRPSDRTQWE